MLRCAFPGSWAYVHVGVRLLVDSAYNTLIVESKRKNPFDAHNLQVNTANPRLLQSQRHARHIQVRVRLSMTTGHDIQLPLRLQLHGVSLLTLCVGLPLCVIRDISTWWRRSTVACLPSSPPRPTSPLQRRGPRAATRHRLYAR